MARLDAERSRIVVRLVYDGPAWAGKTTTLQALARGLGTTVRSGEEADGRTLQFDWAEYVGGRHEGRPIHCEIVSVPGQRVLERRRRLLLETADAVVFVADSRPALQAENAHAFALLGDVLRAARPPVGVVVQANKRDLPDALPLDALRRGLPGGAALAMTESIAERGEGVRETFVLAVRLALDRVRALAAGDGGLPPARLEADAGAALLDALLAAERRPAPERSFAPPAAPVPAAAEADAPPVLPDASLPFGFVWPPVAGRVTVHQLEREALRFERTPRGDWLGASPGWRVLTARHARHGDLDEARHELIAWARWHALAGARLSSPRAIALGPDAGGWRLWQLVGAVPSLLDALRELPALDERAAGARLLRILDLRREAQRTLVAAGWLPRVELGTIGISELGVVTYVGFAPESVATPPADAEELPEAPADEVLLLTTEIGPVLREVLSRTPERLAGVRAAVHRAADAAGRGSVAAALDEVLLGA